MIVTYNLKSSSSFFSIPNTRRVDTWGVVGELATIVKGIGPPDVPLVEANRPQHFFTVSLPEDSFLRGYSPIASAQGSTYYAPRNVNKVG